MKRKRKNDGREILIIEDDEEILRVLKQVLTYEGYLVDTALTGKAGFIGREQRRTW